MEDRGLGEVGSPRMCVWGGRAKSPTRGPRGVGGPFVLGIIFSTIFLGHLFPFELFQGKMGESRFVELIRGCFSMFLIFLERVFDP